MKDPQTFDSIEHSSSELKVLPEGGDQSEKVVAVQDSGMIKSILSKNPFSGHNSLLWTRDGKEKHVEWCSICVGNIVLILFIISIGYALTDVGKILGVTYNPEPY